MQKSLSSGRLDMVSAGERLREMILSQYSTLSEFADELGVTRNTLYHMVRGDARPNIQTLAEICDLLGCSMDFLLGISCPEQDPEEGYETALLNVHEFSASWPRRKKLMLICAILGQLTEEEKLQLGLSHRKGSPGIPPARS